MSRPMKLLAICSPRRNVVGEEVRRPTDDAADAPYPSTSLGAEQPDPGNDTPHWPHRPQWQRGRSAERAPVRPFRNVGGPSGWRAPSSAAESQQAAPQLLSSGNQILISRSADSGESEPWTRFSRLDSDRSPRIVPGAALRPSVAPLMARTTSTASSPSSTAATSGPPVTKARSGG